MEKETEIACLSGHLELLIRQTIAAWQLQNRKLSDLFNKLDPLELLIPVAPDRNRGIYLLGHLIAFNDMMLPQLGCANRLHPELDNLFVCCSDGAADHYPPAATLKSYWYEVNEMLTVNMNKLSVSEWLAQATSVEMAGFEKNPLHNKISILISRTVHLSYHIGQLNLLL
jgi:hypothetical protein